MSFIWIRCKIILNGGDLKCWISNSHDVNIVKNDFIWCNSCLCVHHICWQCRQCLHLSTMLLICCLSSIPYPSPPPPPLPSPLLFHCSSMWWFTTLCRWQFRGPWLSLWWVAPLTSTMTRASRYRMMYVGKGCGPGGVHIYAYMCGVGMLVWCCT